MELLLFRNTHLGTRVRNPLTVAGWGVMKEGSNAVANVLQKVDVAAVSRSTCVRAMDPYEVNPWINKHIMIKINPVSIL